MTLVGATQIYPNDRWPYVVVKQTRLTRLLAPVIDVSLKTGHQPARFHNGFPVWDHVYTDDELERLVQLDLSYFKLIRQHKDGQWYDKDGTRYVLGRAHYYRDFSD